MDSVTHLNTPRLGNHRFEPDKSDEHATKTASRMISRTAPILVQRQRDDGSFDAGYQVNQDGTTAGGMTPPGDPVVSASQVQPNSPASTYIPNAPVAPPMAEFLAQVASAPAVRKTRITFSSDKIGRLATSCLHVVFTDTLIAVGFDAQGDVAEPPANGLSEPIKLQVGSTTFEVVHMGLSFEHGGILWLVLPKA